MLRNRPVPVYENERELVRNTDFTLTENTDKFSVEELAEFLTITEEFKNIYAADQNVVPAARKQFES